MTFENALCNERPKHAFGEYAPKTNIAVFPDYENDNSTEFYGDTISDEYKQSFDEGLDIEEYKDLFDVAARLPKSAIREDIADVIQTIVLNAPYKKDYKYIEPSDYEEIKRLRKKLISDSFTESEFSENKIHGAWMGRICGCMLGKTVEGIRTNELIPFLKKTDNYPMNRYIASSDLQKVDLSDYKYGFENKVYADKICAMPVDDDINYVVLSQIIFEKYGRDFTSKDVAECWLKYQPKDAYFTAERVAFCNFIKGYYPPQSAVHKNPYREWIGAQIRADYWGYINPGSPEKAAEMAHRDASVSHIKNGIYGEMFVAAAIATAAVTNDIKKIILSGLEQIPSTSRLFEDITTILEFFESGKPQKECFRYIHSRYDEYTGYGWCHTNPNAMIVAAALLYGNGDFGKSICTAVETGFDTDCNGATVGSILGMANGLQSIEANWTAPFNDTLQTSIFGVGEVKISDMAKATMEHIKKNKAEIE